MAAQLIFREKFVYANGAIREMVIWRLPEIDGKGRHELKYRLFYGFRGKSAVRYDNERGKGDHQHHLSKEQPSTFISIEQLMADFKADIEHLRGNQHD